MKEKKEAVLRITDAAKLPKNDRKLVAEWLRDKAKELECDYSLMAKNFTATYYAR